MNTDLTKCKIQSIERATRILKCFYKKNEISLKELSEMVILNKNTVYSLAESLVVCGLLSKNTTNGKYSLGMELFHLSTHVDINLRSVALPYMHKLSVKYQENINLTKVDNDAMTYLEQIVSPLAIRLVSDIGTQIGMHCSAVGKVTLAFLPEDMADNMLSMIPFTIYTENTIKSAEELKAQLPQIRQQGYAINDEESAPGVYTVAAPILDNMNMPWGGLTVSGLKDRMLKNWLPEEIIKDLKDYVFEINKYFKNN